MDYRFRGRQKTCSIGPYGNGKDGTFSLADARRERDKLLAARRQRFGRIHAIGGHAERSGRGTGSGWKLRSSASSYGDTETGRWHPGPMADAVAYAGSTMTFVLTGVRE